MGRIRSGTTDDESIPGQEWSNIESISQRRIEVDSSWKRCDLVSETRRRKKGKLTCHLLLFGLIWKVATSQLINLPFLSFHLFLLARTNLLFYFLLLRLVLVSGHLSLIFDWWGNDLTGGPTREWADMKNELIASCHLIPFLTIFIHFHTGRMNGNGVG